MSYIVNAIEMMLILLLWVLMIKKLISSRYSKVKTVKAEILDKYQSNTVSKYPGTFRTKSFIVVFATEYGKLSFAVSEFSYHNYKIKDKGTLKYKGSKIISFQ